jgi:hypothetical protein
VPAELEVAAQHPDQPPAEVVEAEVVRLLGRGREHVGLDVEPRQVVQQDGVEAHPARNGLRRGAPGGPDLCRPVAAEPFEGDENEREPAGHDAPGRAAQLGPPVVDRAALDGDEPHQVVEVEPHLAHRVLAHALQQVGVDERVDDPLALDRVGVEHGGDHPDRERRGGERRQPPQRRAGRLRQPPVRQQNARLDPTVLCRQ